MHISPTGQWIFGLVALLMFFFFYKQSFKAIKNIFSLWILCMKCDSKSRALDEKNISDIHKPNITFYFILMFFLSNKKTPFWPSLLHFYVSIA